MPRRPVPPVVSRSTPLGEPRGVLTNRRPVRIRRTSQWIDWSSPSSPRPDTVTGSMLERGRMPMLLRKEVIQPHLPVRLPCYDFVPIASPTFDGSLHKGWATGFGCCPLS